ncbi:acyl-CoA-binding domain-containing protein 5 isoform X2 [Amborella trichopoda]|uniref:acyl-CoA-binding domain-containing protein 5 isoform X2 n=1 Tax=Amborella trichopoda TaxID=13333 RepID=UPI0005D41C3F|nr:acyl-CoA-binding domain-containing protein 5 isoform X2 [Amborella trichopoda]|eukprot:XP_011627422.1 acyl-CoA-binding domain-containing protein 5 isoform X2 [Amborella trichopoda]
MFGFSRRRMKLGRLKVQLTDSAQGIRSPIRHPKRHSHSNGEGVVSTGNHLIEARSDAPNSQSSSIGHDVSDSGSGNTENWIPLSTLGQKPEPRANHAATVIGCKMLVIGGECGGKLLDDVQVLDFSKLTWAAAKTASKVYLSQTDVMSRVPPCKGHSLVSWGKTVFLIGGKMDPSCDRVSVWAFDVDAEYWSHIDAKGDIPVARSAHTVTRAGSVLIMFGGEDAKGRKLNDLNMFDLKSQMWLPLQYTGTKPSPRSNHVAALYEDKLLLVFGGTSKSRVLNDLYLLDFETMIWSRIKTRGLNPSPRSGCCGILCGAKWYITGGESRKKRHNETLVYDVLKHEWSLAVVSTSSSITTNKGFSMVLVRQREDVFLVAFGGSKKEPSNQVESLLIAHNEQSTCQYSAPEKDPPQIAECSTIFSELTNPHNASAPSLAAATAAKPNFLSILEHHFSGRRSQSESNSTNIDTVSGNVSLRKQHHEEDHNSVLQIQRNHTDTVYGEPDDLITRTATLSQGVQVDIARAASNSEAEMLGILEPENPRNLKITGNLQSDNGDSSNILDIDGKVIAPANSHQEYEIKVAALQKKNGVLEGQLSAALAGREAIAKNLSAVLKSRQDIEKKLSESLKEMEVLSEKLAAAELAQEEANSLSNIVHSDNVRLEHDVAFLKAVLDDTQKELQSTRGVLAGERARAFQLQVEVFHLKQRLQSVENRAPTPRKPYHI